MAATLRGHGRQRDEARQGLGGGKREVEAHVRQPCHGIGRCQIHHRKKALKPCEKRTIIGAVRQKRPKDIGKACRLLRLNRSSLNYASVKKNTPPKVFGSATTVCAIRARP